MIKRKNRKQSNFKVIYSACGEVLLQFTPSNFELDKFEDEERKSMFQKPGPKPTPEPKPEQEKKVLDQLKKRATDLYELYLTHSFNRRVILSNLDASKELDCSVRTIIRAKNELLNNGIIRTFYNQKLKSQEIELLVM